MFVEHLFCFQQTILSSNYVLLLLVFNVYIFDVFNNSSIDLVVWNFARSPACELCAGILWTGAVRSASSCPRRGVEARIRPRGTIYAVVLLANHPRYFFGTNDTQVAWFMLLIRTGIFLAPRIVKKFRLLCLCFLSPFRNSVDPPRIQKSPPICDTLLFTLLHQTLRFSMSHFLIYIF